jgi:hypothetical protein
MLHASLVLAATEAEPSKTAFYVAGALLVAWAIVLFGVGMRRPDFPGAGRPARGVMGLTAVLVLVVLTTSIVTA